jgi:hypothetical protein
LGRWIIRREDKRLRMRWRLKVILFQIKIGKFVGGIFKENPGCDKIFALNQGPYIERDHKSWFNMAVI